MTSGTVAEPRPRFSEKDFAKPVEELIQGTPAGAAAALAGVFAAGYGGPIAGAAASALVQRLAQIACNTATQRFLAAGREWDAERQRAQVLSQFFVSEVAPQFDALHYLLSQETSGIHEQLDALARQEDDNFQRIILAVHRSVATREGQEQLLAAQQSQGEQLEELLAILRQRISNADPDLPLDERSPDDALRIEFDSDGSFLGGEGCVRRWVVSLLDETWSGSVKATHRMGMQLEAQRVEMLERASMDAEQANVVLDLRKRTEQGDRLLSVFERAIELVFSARYRNVGRPTPDTPALAVTFLGELAIACRLRDVPAERVVPCQLFLPRSGRTPIQIYLSEGEAAACRHSWLETLSSDEMKPAWSRMVTRDWTDLVPAWDFTREFRITRLLPGLAWSLACAFRVDVDASTFSGQADPLDADYWILAIGSNRGLRELDALTTPPNTRGALEDIRAQYRTWT